MEIIKSSGKFEIIKLSDDVYAVRKTTKGFFGGIKKVFMVLNRKGTDFEYDSVVEGVTSSSLEVCEYIFNANIAKE